MKLSALVVSTLLPSLVCGTLVSYDNAYDKPGASITTVACSDGSYGLLSRGFTTFDSLPHYPRIGGAASIAGWNSPNCGTCFQLTYTNVASKANKTIPVLMIDKADVGFNIALAAMNELTGGRAVELGTIQVSAKQVIPSVCGLKG